MKTIHLSAILLIIANSSFAIGQDTKAAPKVKKVATVKLSKKNVESFQGLEGVLESRRMIKIRTRFDEWSDLQVKHVVKQGERVEEGADLLSFDTKSIDKAVVEAKFAYETAVLTLMDAELAAKENEQTNSMERDLAERKWKNAQADHTYYKEVTVPQREKDLEYSRKSASYSLEYSKDELDQLEQMYKEDDLTEESEEIVLKRAQRSVEAAERSMERVLQSIKRQKDLDNPRKDKEAEDTLKRQKVEYEKSKIALDVKTQRAQITLEKAKVDVDNKKQKYNRLVKDQKSMVISSPASGLVYYGDCVDGKWVGSAGTASRDIRPGSKLLRDKTVITLVDPSTMMIRATVDEDQLSELKPGLPGIALIKATDEKVSVKIKSISNVPNSAGKFVCEIELGQLPADSKAVPSMNCKLSFQTFSNPQATVAPKASVFSDDGGISHYVMAVKDDKTQKRTVRVGPVSGSHIVILDGVDGVTEIAKQK